MLRALYRDWAASPVSGTAAIVSTIGAGVSFGVGNYDRALLFLILGTVMLIGRREDTK